MTDTRELDDDITELEKTTEHLDIEDDFIDENYLKDLELQYSDEEKESKTQEAFKLKTKGNDHFKSGNFIEARTCYTQALKTCPISLNYERSILYGNRAACFHKEQETKKAISDCSKSLELYPRYLKVLKRRAQLYETDSKFDESLDDFKKALELSPNDPEALSALTRLPDKINERNEKLKKEMFSSLKSLGDKILNPFGLSTDNFQLQQDPNSGGYTINFNKNK